MRAAILVAAAVLLMSPAAFAQIDGYQSSPLQAQEPSAPTSQPEVQQQGEQATEQQTESSDDPVICRSQVASTESRLRRQRTRICHTRSEWESMQDRAAREVNRAGQTAITRD
jgi:hypothetical protein